MRNKLKEKVVISGVGCSRFGDMLETPELKGLSMQEVVAVAVREALEDAGLSGQDVDAVYVGNAMVHSSQLPGTYSQLSKWIGTELKAGVHFEAQCSTTNVGASLAAMSIASGVYDRVLVLGFETTRTRIKGFSPYQREALQHKETWLWTDMAVNQAYGVPQGYDIFSTYNGLLALGYCRKYGLSIEDFDKGMFELCRTRRLHGSLNPKANVQQTLEAKAGELGYADAYQMWRADEVNPFVAWPSRLMSLVTTADGASAMVLTRAEAATTGTSPPVALKGFGISYRDLPWYGKDPTLWDFDKRSADLAMEMAGIKVSDIDYLHTHDCSHISGICTAEMIGYLPSGKGLTAARDGDLRFDGKRPMSTHGGRHAFGHAWAASAGSDTYEAVLQMRGLAGKRQMPKRPEIAVIHTHGYAMIGTTLVLGGA
ncbi:MAG: thiolase family protein [Pelovirga sp.]